MIEVEGKTILSRLIENLQPHVDLIKVVVGYREEMVIDYCAQHHRNVILVRNKDYRQTNTAFSFAKGANLSSGKVLYLDGDLVISPESLEAFIQCAASKEILVGLTDAKSENAVFADCNTTSEGFMISAFSRTKPSPLEWANVVSGPAHLLDGASGYVFERLEEYLPLNGKLLELAEVDTAGDLIAAREFVCALDSKEA
ncbi:DUF6564 domain-containing protein [Pseudomonas arcuscaelestis]|nr:DUF6564 domain-containing protein [Pseudomonas arcuscaelestis]